METIAEFRFNKPDEASVFEISNKKLEKYYTVKYLDTFVKTESLETAISLVLTKLRINYLGFNDFHQELFFSDQSLPLSFEGLVKNIKSLLSTSNPSHFDMNSITGDMTFNGKVIPDSNSFKKDLEERISLWNSRFTNNKKLDFYHLNTAVPRN